MTAVLDANMVTQLPSSWKPGTTGGVLTVLAHKHQCAAVASKRVAIWVLEGHHTLEQISCGVMCLLECRDKCGLNIRKGPWLVWPLYYTINPDWGYVQHCVHGIDIGVAAVWSPKRWSILNVPQGLLSWSITWPQFVSEVATPAVLAVLLTTPHSH